jgi:hypothetical protein
VVLGEIFATPGTRPAIQPSPKASTNMPVATIHLLPTRSDSIPATGAAKMMITDMGAMTRPALMAEKPSTDCRKIGMVKKAPIMAALSSRPVALPAAKSRLWNREKSMSGWLTRCSRQ